MRWRVMLLVAGCLTAGCAHRNPLDVSLGPDVAAPRHKAVLFFVDALGAEALDEALADGRAPNIRRYLIDRGCRVRTAVTTVPSITYAVTVTMLTGQLPGHHGVVANKFFDPRTLRYQDYGYIRTYRSVEGDFLAPTIYELLADDYTVSIQCACRRGVRRTIDNWATSGINWFFGWYETVDRLTAIRFELIAESANTVGQWPRFVHAYMPAVDEVGHRCGRHSDRYRAAVANADAQIGRVCDALDRAGLLDSTYLALVGDHGMVPIVPDQRLDVAAWLGRHRGLGVYSGLTEQEHYVARYRLLEGYDAVVAANAGRHAAVYLRAATGWQQPPGAGLDAVRAAAAAGQAERSVYPGGIDLDELVELPAVGLAAWRLGDDAVMVARGPRRGVCWRQRRDGQTLYRYQPIGPDPLGYVEAPSLRAFVRAGWHDSRAWLEATAEAAYPDAVPQIVELFDSPRSGDIVLFAAAGWGFNRTDQAGHGSLSRAEMLVPMVFAGPGIPAGTTVPCGRICDLMPTLLDLMGRRDWRRRTGPIDGLSLAGPLKEAATGPDGAGLRGPPPAGRSGREASGAATGS